jgi:sporulation protein YlmC with PRC-barrel domain
MRVDLDAKVRAHDGEALGSVKRAVVDPRRNAITHFVLNTGGLLGRDVMVPSDEIERARPDGDAIRLALRRDEVERLPTYAPAEYAAPPADWTFPGAYAFGAYGGFVWPVAAAPATAGRIATGPSRPTIGKEAVVYASGGQDVGVVDDVRFDAATGELRGFVLRIGGVLRTLLGGGETVQVGRDAIAAVEDGAVRLRLTSEEVERLAW